MKLRVTKEEFDRLRSMPGCVETTVNMAALLGQAGDTATRTVDPVKTPKYRNRKTEIDGRVFDSKHESQVYLDLRERQRIGQITNLRCQVPIPLMVNGRHIADYIADFTHEESGKVIVTDAKSKVTRRLPVYRLKRKILEANGIVITEV